MMTTKIRASRVSTMLVGLLALTFAAAPISIAHVLGTGSALANGSHPGSSGPDNSGGGDGGGAPDGSGNGNPGKSGPGNS